MIRGRTDVVGVRQHQVQGRAVGARQHSNTGCGAALLEPGASVSRAILHLENRGNGVLRKETSFI